MVDISIRDGTLEVRVKGWSGLWALKSRIRVPIGRVRVVRRAPNVVRGIWKGWRFPGTHLPGVIAAGTYYRRGTKEFWDARRWESAVAIELEDAAYDRLVVDVEDPGSVIRRIEAARRERGR